MKPIRGHIDSRLITSAAPGAKLEGSGRWLLTGPAGTAPPGDWPGAAVA